MLIVSGCGSWEHNPTQPFIITSKVINQGGYAGECSYRYIGQNGVEGHFIDTNDKFNVGDTL